ncbi:MAG: hypothetical protein KatS3mg111_1927 [Pirellulaceae bacterium]|nr:MAG: hypothetical protein KatS3mg111_1927 [Pirellulaceae bacterium]
MAPLSPPLPCPPRSEVTIALMRDAISAVAAAEDLDFSRSVPLWDRLADALPANPSIRLNRAITVLKWIDETHNLLASGKVQEEAARRTIESELAAAYAKAEAVVGSLRELHITDYRAALLEAELLRAKARQVDLEAGQRLRRQAVQILYDALAPNPAQPILAASYDDLVQEFLTATPELGELQADALYASSQAMPRNLFLLFRACDVLVRSEDPRLADLLDRTLELTLPMRGDVANYLRRLDPQELVAETKRAIAAGDWSSARGIIRWINLFKGMAGFKTDRRLVKPDLLALLEVDFLDQLAQQLPAVAAHVTPPPTQQTRLLHELTTATWYDFDLDLDFDLAIIDATLLTIWRNDDGELHRSYEVELPWPAAGAVAVDLFPVDAPNRPRVDSVAAWMQEHHDAVGNSPSASTATTNQPTAEDIVRGRRHDTPQALLIFGSQGLAVVQPQPGPDQLISRVDLVDVSWPQEITSVQSVVPLDIESDGDLDLLVSTANGPRVLQNNGDGSFSDTTQFSSFTEGLVLDSLRAGDWDRDLDQDVIGIDTVSGKVILLENILHGQLRSVDLSQQGWPLPSSSGARQVAISDLNGDGSWDIVSAGDQEVVIAFGHRPEPYAWRPLRSVRTSVPGSAVEVGDWNNDGYSDVIVAANKGTFLILGSADWLTAPPLHPLSDTENVLAIDAIDANGDGTLDVVETSSSSTNLISSLGAESQGYLLARVRGIADDNGGGRINHYAVGTLLELRSGGWAARRVVKHPTTHFGIGELIPDNLRIVFPNGLTQNVQQPGRNVLIEEKQELKGSCPFVYGWNGQRFELITDLLWNAPLGLQIAPGEVLPDRRWEYLFLPGELVQAKDGYIELRITEELWEVAYFDHVALSAVDHPVETPVLTNEKVGPPHLAQPRLYQIHHTRELVRAVDGSGRDWTATLAVADDNFTQSFDALRCQGLADPHFIELDFGTLPTEKDLKLVLRGWMHPTDTSLNISLSQNSRLLAPEPPSLWVLDEQGQWVCAQPFMGFPGGKPKTIVVDLQDVFRADDHRLRIATTQQIYWDYASVAWDTEPSELHQEPLPLVAAELRYRGFGRLLPRRSDQPHWYDYHDADPTPKWPPIEGPFTRFGDVRELLAADDDRLVVMTSGDEIVLRFRLPEAHLPSGWKRDYVLHSVGWDKDADLNTLAGQSSLPLPFRAQTGYPPPPEQEEEAARVWALNRPTLTRVQQYAVE